MNKRGAWILNTKTAVVQKPKRKKIKKNELELYSLCLIPLLSLFIFNYIPMFGIIIAFKDYRYNLGILGSKWVGFNNFKFFFESDTFTTILWNTLFMNLIFIVVGIIASVLVAILLFEIRSRNATKVYQTMLITPNFLSWVIVSYMVYAFLNPQYGLVNGLLKLMGREAIDWYATPGAWPVILTIASVWKHVGMDSVVYYAALMGLDTSLFEAAEVDGANKVQVTMKIVIPMLIPLISVLTILKIGNIFRADFGLFYQVTRNVGLLYSKTDVIDTYIFRTMRVVGDMGMGSAVGLEQSLVGFILVIATNAAAKKIDPDTALF